MLWTFADTDQSVHGGFAQIASLLNLPEKEAAEKAKVTAAVERWLEENPGWLLVFDNADDPGVVKEFLPPQKKCQVLLTSRAHEFQKIGIFSPREVDVLSPKEAREFLLHRTGKDPAAKSPEADALAKELGYLPLALEQAAAYIVEKGASFATYLAGFKKQRQALLNKQGPVLGNEAKEQQKRTVFTTWAVNFSDIENNSPASADLLRLSAFLAPDTIPLELLEKASKDMSERLATKLAEASDNPLALDELLSPLLCYSLVRRNEETRSYGIHPMLQEVVREGLTEQKRKEWAERAVRLVSGAFPDPEKFKNWRSCERLLPHALVCAEFINSFLLEFAEAGLLLNEAAFYLHHRAEYEQAESMSRRSLEITAKVRGPEHAETAIRLNNLASLYHSQGRYKEAEPLYQKSLEIREKVLGANDSQIATSLNNLAELYRTQGRYKEAAPLYRRVLEISENVLGLTHPNTAANLNNLALLLEKQGQDAEAEQLHRRALEILEKALGPDHPHTAHSLNNLAGLLKGQGKHAESEPLYRRALEIDKKTVGPNHPDTAVTLNNLGMLLALQEKYAEAGLLFRRALEICQNALGADHPSTAAVRNNLLQFYREQGRSSEADALEKAAKEKAQ